MIERLKRWNRIKYVVLVLIIIAVADGAIRTLELQPSLPSFVGDHYMLVTVALYALPVIVAVVLEIFVRRKYAAIDDDFTHGYLLEIYPPERELSVAQAERLWNQVSDLVSTRVRFGIEGDEKRIVYTCQTTDEPTAYAIKAMLRADYPGIDVELLREPLLRKFVPDDWQVVEIECRPSDWEKPIESRIDVPLLAPLAEMGRTEGAITGIYADIRDGKGARKQLIKKQKKARIDPTDKRDRNGKSKRESRAQRDKRKETDKQMTTRLANPFLECRIVVWAAAEKADHAQGAALRVSRDYVAQYQQFNRIGRHTRKGGRIKPGVLKKTIKLPSAEGVTLPYTPYTGQPMTDDDLALLMHVVGANKVVEQLQTVSESSGDAGLSGAFDMDF